MIIPSDLRHIISYTCFIVAIANHKAAIVTPILKKPTMDSLDPASYRPVSNLTFVSKLVEKIVSVRLSEFADQHTLLPHVQSAYRPFHSTETAVAAVHNDMIGALDRGEIGALVLLDMSAAFDTVDHSVLLATMERRFAVTDDALAWDIGLHPRSITDGARRRISVRTYSGVMWCSTRIRLGTKNFLLLQ